MFHMTSTTVACRGSIEPGAGHGLRPRQSGRDGTGALVADSGGRWPRVEGHEWDALDRLHAKGYISDPKSKAKSVVLSEEGERLSRELFERHFGSKG